MDIKIEEALKTIAHHRIDHLETLQAEQFAEGLDLDQIQFRLPEFRPGKLTATEVIIQLEIWYEVKENPSVMELYLKTQNNAKLIEAIALTLKAQDIDSRQMKGFDEWLSNFIKLRNENF